MRLLWASNYSSQSGYSIQARLFVPRIQALGHEVLVFELSHGTRVASMQNSIKILPTGLDPLGADMMRQHMERHEAHAVITLIDAWGMNKDIMKDLSWFPYTPVDTYPLAPAVKESLSAARAVIAMSRYGETQLKNNGFDTYYMPHAIDPAIWYPRSKALARQMINVDPDIFFVSFVGVNDSNPSRKGIPELLMAWQIFHDKHPDSALYMHTTKRGRLPLGATQGVDIPKIIETFGLDSRSIKFADEYRLHTGFPAEQMATIASAADVLILPTRGEGFGIPVLEYAAVGTPSIVSDVAASSELCFDGWLLEGEYEWSWQNALVMKPGIASIVEKLEAAYADRNNPRRAQKCIEGAREYHIDHVFAKYTAPLIKNISEMILDQVVVAS